MPWLLSQRDTRTTEIMDDPRCDCERLFRTYRQFRAVNAALSRIRSVYKRWIRPAMRIPERSYSLLDIGFGGGDIARALHRWACADGLRLAITGIDIDARAYRYVKTLDWPERVTFRVADVSELRAEQERYDFVFSNHLVHHLDTAALPPMLASAAALCAREVLFVDVRRSDLAYLGFAFLSAVAFRDSYIRHDGLISIKRSYTFRELAAIAPPGWTVERLFPFRLVLRYAAAAEA
ncbi:MAG: methyltransferase domain-containing protein [Chromatiales bacterium]